MVSVCGTQIVPCTIGPSRHIGDLGINGLSKSPRAKRACRRSVTGGGRFAIDGLFQSRSNRQTGAHLAALGRFRFQFRKTKAPVIRGSPCGYSNIFKKQPRTSFSIDPFMRGSFGSTLFAKGLCPYGPTDKIRLCGQPFCSLMFAKSLAKPKSCKCCRIGNILRL